MSTKAICLPTLFFNLTLISTLILFYVSTASAGVGSSSISQNDNTDPARANPRFNITCVGDYGEALPVDAGFSPIYAPGISMQELCAKTQYGGGQPGKHIGGWCQWGRYHSDVVFDLGVGAQINPVVATPRIMTACSYRCFCNYGVAPGGPQPKYGDFAETWESDETYELQLDVVDDFDVPWTENMAVLPANDQVEVPTVSHRGTAGKNPVTVAQLQTESEQAYTLDPSGAEPRSTYVSMDADNNIECHGYLPSFPLPSPFNRQDFSTLQEFCAVQFSGGKR